jgi:hypothetical protein
MSVVPPFLPPVSASAGLAMALPAARPVVGKVMCGVKIAWPLDEWTATDPPAPAPSRKARPRITKAACRFHPLLRWSSRLSSAGMKIEEDHEEVFEEDIPLTPSLCRCQGSGPDLLEG